ncbi:MULTISPECIES: Trk system potassium transporter TrkA [Peptoniphilus]|jgi:potassium uptake protein trkA|uniref:Trk system potassium transporter TrkA n=1 Tax=Peptoniphilus TaxID=162289 RepID=UPI00028A1853|nr:MULTISPECIES: Trk system potassium transporter TrkA [Peptoniphilus]MBS6610506.1 Trk system potassium transporter TrkA [Peptoniphilus harei]MDU1043017.1 Trk system potassium transporter TrkA [Peptoniphilus rhinitidis]MDU1954893.1 Trk system potassium transporter TrkA [Peptoniphilus lacydonensis]MDU2109165.1 Trk system potassium transporter TrkA [Peptoniphilus lacydonensis]MDU2114736.1 Trk system potassium transporter TrkA [Peptoniphilus lacydonensis]
MKALVVGAGKLGHRIAASLLDENYEVTVVDNNEDVIENISNSLDVFSICANALDFGVLEELEISNYDYVIATTTNDEANVILCTISKKLGAKFAIARVRDPEYRKHLDFISEELEIDKIINPDYATARSIVKYLMKRYQLYSDEFAGGKVSLVEFNIGNDPNFIGKKIMDIEKINDLLISAISRNGEAIIPNGRTVLEENDVIIFAGKSESIENFDKEHTGVNRTKSLRNTMILGGGKTGLYLAMLLLKENIEVTIVEINRERCLQLKEMVPDANIINGDGTDIAILQEEMVHTYDSFVAATGIDEANLLMSLVAKQTGIYKSVAKISRTNYDKVLDRLDIDAVFNTSYITAAEILKEIRGKSSLSLHLLLNGKVECIELIIKSSHLVCGKEIENLNLPDGVLIIAIVRNKEMLVPNGKTVLESGDRIILFSMHQIAAKVQKIFSSEGRLSDVIKSLKGRGKKDEL